MVVEPREHIRHGSSEVYWPKGLQGNPGISRGKRIFPHLASGHAWPFPSLLWWMN